MRAAILLFLFFISVNTFAQTNNKKTGPTKKPVTTQKKSIVLPKKNPVVAKKTPTKTLPKTSPLKAVTKKDSVKTLPTTVQKTAVRQESVMKMAMRERQMIEEVNLVRAKPNEYKQYIINYLKSGNPDVATRKAATELIKILEDMQPLLPLQFSDQLYKAAKSHGDWMADADMISHSTLPYAENLVAGVSSIRDAIIILLIDKEDSRRGHRLNLLNPKFKFIGIYEVKGEIGGMMNAFVQELSYKE